MYRVPLEIQSLVQHAGGAWSRDVYAGVHYMTCFPSAALAPGAIAPSVSPILTQIRDLIYRVAGIFQANNRLKLLQERCQKRMQVLGIASLRDYYERLT